MRARAWERSSACVCGVLAGMLATAALEITEVELVIASVTCADCAVRV